MAVFLLDKGERVEKSVSASLIPVLQATGAQQPAPAPQWMS